MAQIQSSVNRCRRCNRKLSNPYAVYGWRCARKLGVAETLNYSGDKAYRSYMDGIRKADEFIKINKINPKKKNIFEIISDYLKMFLSEITGDMETFWDSFENLSDIKSSKNKTKDLNILLEDIDKNDYSSGRRTTNKYTDNNFNEAVYNMQREFNEQGTTDKYGNKLKEDGVYGPNTQWARNAYIGMFPSTNIIDPLQSKITDVGYRKFVKGHGKLPPTVANTKYQLYDKRNNSRLFEIEYHPIKTNTQAIRHINTISPKGATKLQKKAADSLNHKEVSQEVFDNFRNFDEIIDNVKFAGKAVAAAGVILETVEYGDTVYRDLNDADGKLGKETLKASVGIVGEWAGGLTGAKLGAMGGAAFGSAILLGAGTAVGGFVGGTIGGIIGSIAGNDLAEGFIEGYYTGD